MKKSSQLNFLFYISLFLLINCSLLAQQQLTNIPSVYINTTNNQSVSDKTTWVTGNVIVVSQDTSIALNMPMEIRGRGNSTWGFSKKPYRMKLDKKTNFMNMPAHAKDWVFLANHADKTLIRNAVAFKIGHLLGLQYSPAVQFVDLTLNNNYLGNYMVTDQMEVNPGRVDIEKQDTLDTTEPNITGGYLLEIDGFASGEPVWFTTTKGMKITVKSPDDEKINPEQLDYISNYIEDFEARLFSTDFKDPFKGYRAYVDSASLVNWYIASELTGNSDAFWSTYIYKKRSDNKLYFGPLWDYDIAFNNDDRLGDATEKLMSQYAHVNRTWIERMLQDEWFKAAVWKRWQLVVENNISGALTNYIDELSEMIDLSQQRNFIKWNMLNTRVYRETYLFPTYAQGVDYLKTYIGNRITFLNNSLKYIEPPKPSEPFVASNYNYLLINKKTNNVVDVTDNSLLLNSKLVMWEPIDEDAGQMWQIKQLNDSLFRFVNKNSALAMAGNGRGANLIQVAVNDNDNSQQWKIKPVSTGNLYGIVNMKSGYSINNSGGGFANGTNVIEYNNNIAGSENQQWYIQKINLINTGFAQSSLLKYRVEIYPNPASDLLSIRFDADVPQNIVVSIFDLTGRQRMVLNENFNSTGKHEITIPLTEMEAGMYFVQLINEKSEKTILKFVKK